MADSRRINANLRDEEQKLPAEERPPFDLVAVILSSEFWPPLKEEKLELPESIKEAMEAYSKKYEKLKVSVGCSQGRGAEQAGRAHRRVSFGLACGGRHPPLLGCGLHLAKPGASPPLDCMAGGCQGRASPGVAPQRVAGGSLAGVNARST